MRSPDGLLAGRSVGAARASRISSGHQPSYSARRGRRGGSEAGGRSEFGGGGGGALVRSGPVGEALEGVVGGAVGFGGVDDDDLLEGGGDGECFVGEFELSDEWVA